MNDENNINLDEIRKLANMIDVFANCLQQDINLHCDELDKGRHWDLLPTGTPRRTQIQGDIKFLRRKLMELSKRIGGES